MERLLNAAFYVIFAPALPCDQAVIIQRLNTSTTKRINGSTIKQLNN